MPRRSRDQSIGQWRLIDPLGQGGNAEVWRATDGHETVALKILNQRRGNSEPYRRFRQEIEALEQIGTQPGIMPLLCSNLPEQPSTDQPAWLAMPIGVPLADSLSLVGLRDVVSAVAQISSTLAELHERNHIHHRDIKPSNLYMLDEQPVISDFGLVDLPEAADLTAPGYPLGPRYFLPYEMIADPMRADPAPADVFSLAKTLWVLSVDQRWPPQGEQHASNTAYSIGTFRPHALSHHLDELIERCTQHDPIARPSMRQVANDLRAWLDLDSRTPQQATDLSAIWNRLREVAEPKLRQAREETIQRQCFHSATRKLQELLAPLHSEIRRQFPAAQFDQRLRFVDTLFSVFPKNEITNEDIRATVLSGSGWNPVSLIIGTSVRTWVSDEIEVQGLFYLGHTKTLGGYLGEWRSEPKRDPCGSIAVESNLHELATSMQDSFPAWLEKFTDAMDSSHT